MLILKGDSNLYVSSGSGTGSLKVTTDAKDPGAIFKMRSSDHKGDCFIQNVASDFVMSKLFYAEI